jgi:hypothetical protein
MKRKSFTRRTSSERKCVIMRLNKLFYEAVKKAGQKPYEAGQKKACVCK